MNFREEVAIFCDLPKSGAEATRTPDASRRAEIINLREASGVRECSRPLFRSQKLSSLGWFLTT